MSWRNEWKPLLLLTTTFLFCFYLPVETLETWIPLKSSVWEALHLVRWYAQEHVLLCLIPAFFIAGAIAVFVSQASVMKFLGARAHKGLAYGVASISGTILAVCSCTVLPLFAGIYRMGAGLGPATAFLYSGPAINVLAIILTARVLGVELGLARAIGATLFSIVIGLLMHFFFRREENEKAERQMHLPASENTRPLWKTAVFFVLMVGILVFANWGKPQTTEGFWHILYSAKWIITLILFLGFSWTLIVWIKLSKVKVLLTGFITLILATLFHHEPLIPFSVAVIGLSWSTSLDKNEGGEWFEQTWGFTKQIMPLLLAGVMVAGFLLGRPGHEGLIPSTWIAQSVGGNSWSANFFASFAGAFMYFATLTEVPILQGLLGAGMGKGPALALLLAGPALSLPNMLVIRSIMGTKKTITFVLLVVLMATVTGWIYGTFF